MTEATTIGPNARAAELDHALIALLESMEIERIRQEQSIKNYFEQCVETLSREHGELRAAIEGLGTALIDLRDRVEKIGADVARLDRRQTDLELKVSDVRRAYADAYVDTLSGLPSVRRMTRKGSSGQ